MNNTQFQPAFPASCKSTSGRSDLQLLIFFSFCAGPFVTTVGATTHVNPEVATNFSGGGFSNYFDAPSYQSTATAAFLETLGNQYSGLYK